MTPGLQIGCGWFMKQTKRPINTMPPTAQLICSKCGHSMEAMMEDIDYTHSGEEHIISTVFHCWGCDRDRELIRTFTDDGEVTSVEERRYFFG